MKHLKTHKRVAIGVFALLGIVSFVALISGDTEIGKGLISLLFETPTGLSLGFAAASGYSQEGTVTSTKDDGTMRVHYDNSVSDEIVKMKPSSSPLDSILRKTNKIVPVKSWETEWYAVDVRGSVDDLAADVTSGSQTNWEAIDVTVTNPHIFSVDDNIKVSGLPLLPNFVLHVVGKAGSVLSVIPVYPSNNTPTVGAPIYGATTKYQMPTIDISATPVKLTRIGNAKAEKDAQTTPYATFPEKFSNYCQVHMAQVEESVHSRLHSKEVKHDIYDYQVQSLYDMRRAMEYSSLFGVRGLIYDPVESEYKYLSGGLNEFIERELTYSTINDDLFLGWSKTLFTGNSGSEQRFIFGGSSLIENIGKVNTVQKQIEAKQTEVVFGIKFHKVETPFGILYIKHHQLYDDVGMTAGGNVLDVAHIEKHVFKSMESRELELIKSGQKMANAFVVDETFCLALKYPDTHARIVYQP